MQRGGWQLAVQGGQDLCCDGQHKEALPGIAVAQSGVLRNHSHRTTHGEEQKDGDVDLQAQWQVLSPRRAKTYQMRSGPGYSMRSEDRAN